MSNEADNDAYVVEKQLAQDGGPRRQLRFGLVRAGARRFLEARIYFEKSPAQMMPTRKGVVFTASNFLTLLRTVEAHAEEIREWLGLSFTPTGVRDNIARVANHGPARVLPSELKWAFVEAGRGSPPFALEDEGGRVTVNFNAMHAWVIQRVQPLPEAAQRAVAELVAADAIAQRIACASAENSEFDGAFELMDIHRTVILDSVRGR